METSNQKLPFPNSPPLFYNEPSNSPLQKNENLTNTKKVLHAKGLKLQENTKWVSAAKTALTISLLSGSYWAYQYFETKPIPPKLLLPIFIPESLTWKVVSAVMAIAGIVIVKNNLLFLKNSGNEDLSYKSGKLFSKQPKSKNHLTTTEKSLQNAEAKKLLQSFENAQVLIFKDEKTFLSKFDEVISYINKLKQPLDDDQKSLVQSYTTFIINMIEDQSCRADLKIHIFSQCRKVSDHLSRIADTSYKTIYETAGKYLKEDYPKNLLKSFENAQLQISINEIAFLNEYEKVISYLKEQEHPLNDDQKLLVHSYTNFLIRMINDPSGSKEMQKKIIGLYAKNCYKLFQIAPDSYQQISEAESTQIELKIPSFKKSNKVAKLKEIIETLKTTKGTNDEVFNKIHESFVKLSKVLTKMEINFIESNQTYSKTKITNSETAKLRRLAQINREEQEKKLFEEQKKIADVKGETPLDKAVSSLSMFNSFVNNCIHLTKESKDVINTYRIQVILQRHLDKREETRSIKKSLGLAENESSKKQELFALDYK